MTEHPDEATANAADLRPLLPARPLAGDGSDPRRLREAIVEAVGLLPAVPPADPADRYSVRHLTVLWLEADKSLHTRRAYFADLADWLTWCGRTELDPLRARRADVDAWKATITVTGPDGAARPAAASTVARKLASVSSWYRYLQSNDAADRNPAGAVKRPRTARSSPLPALDPEDVAALLDHAEARALSTGSEAAHRDAAVVAVLFYTGLRVSAVTSARVDDLGRDAGHRVLRFWKKGNTRDFVPLAPPALAAVDRYLEVRAARAAVSVPELSGPLFATAPHPYDSRKPGGRQLTQRDVWGALRRLARRAGIPSAKSITPHTARRTAGTLLLAHGVPVQKVQDLLGHADIRTTRDSYDAHRHKLDSSPAYTLAEVLSRHRHDRRRPEPSG